MLGFKIIKTSQLEQMKYELATKSSLADDRQVLLVKERKDTQSLRKQLNNEMKRRRELTSEVDCLKKSADELQQQLSNISTISSLHKMCIIPGPKVGCDECPIEKYQKCHKLSFSNCYICVCNEEDYKELMNPKH